MPQRGFTLLELLVVLVLVGMIAGMVGPRFIDLAERLRHRNEWQTLQQRINGLPMEVQLTGRPMALQELPWMLPAGWQLKTERPVRYLSNGVCLGGQLQLLQGDEVKRRIVLTPPYCQWEGRAW
ncbi:MULTISPECIES: prepilin-type N-terminal cleavage/methylation domain-containing protein [Aeromonas]|uniref:prepilin-type N-terminal cleavage/methylation domain-containing protein n=1 Tax=Aeromonas TaxID=642 RepID=UPI00073C7388|nr:MULTISPECIES: prepilin-type N-terminal cleavage/methylation domain-containing protein [Aeromonas]KTA77981.1 prepilin cleavage protein [Aeromonas salmonicida]MBS2780647.1 prepilin-type N-terminal cleavage/methylation domain-containing protein [Aeromonas salmonicida]MDE7529575.1 prepilin-type N-terminal cleavage/methylation domain-containing protein [Aeromonas salmonicida]MDE7533841.1 prepilin-type N-terminal cleavage/methylation domain-containing protein [Aeromonas salmonicida]MUG30554.1 pre